MNRALPRPLLLPIALLAILLAAPAWAQERDDDPGDAVLQAMLAELARASEELSIYGAEAPYHVGLQVIETHRVGIHGEEGGLQGYRPSSSRVVHADVRVGGPNLDSTHPLRDVGWDEPPPPGRELGNGDDPEVLQREIWREIEARYRVAQERWQRVLADQQVLVAEEQSWDLAPVEPEQELGEPADLAGVDLAAWEDAARRASAVFASSDLTQDPVVSLSGEAETRWFVSTEGHALREGRSRFRTSIRVDTLADDGTMIQLFEAWDAADAAGLPDADTLVAEATALQGRLVALRDAPEQEPYQGPAVLAGRAAAVFFHEIFGHRVEGHRLKRVDDAQTFRNQVGEAILPDFLSVYDDPTVAALGGQDLRGHYGFDDEGVRAERVTLVRDGVLVGFLESRSPVGEAGRSNAHGRRQAGNDVVTRQGNLIIEASATIDDDELRGRLIAAARADGLPYGLVIDDIEGGFTFTDRDIPNAFQIDVVAARRVYVDGRPDEMVRGIDLIGTPLQTFSKIVAAGPTPEVFNGTCGAESGWVPVSAAAPALLIGQVETQRAFKGQARPPLLAPPVGDALPTEAADGSDLLLATMEAEAARSLAELRIEDADPPSRVAVAVHDKDDYRVSADFGHVRRESGSEGRPTRVEVVVGDDAQNSSRIEGGAVATLPDALKKPVVVVDDVPAGIARDLWITADASYKAAVQRIALKRAVQRSMGGEAPPPDWTAAEPVSAVDLSPIPAVDRALLRRIATEASARLRPLGGSLRAGQVIAGEIQGRVYVVDTDGMRIVQPEGHAAVYAYADIVREDGVRLFDRRQWVARTAAELPSPEVIADAVEEMGTTLVIRAASQAVDYYEGPVVFEGEAAADLFRYLLPNEVRGTPPSPEAGRTYQQQTRGGPRIGRRVLPRGWTVVDDPSAVGEGMAGGYAYDREGVPAQAVELVDDGYVRDLAMTRVPRRGRVGSNGHARGAVQRDWGARLSSWTVKPKRLVGANRFEREVAALRRAAGQPAVLVVRRMEQGWEGDLPLPTEAVWRFPDGREIPVLALEFQGVDRRTLRAIVAATGGMQTRAYLAPWTVWGRAGTVDGLPMVLTAPGQVVVGELEAVFPGTTEERPRLPMPAIGPAAPPAP
jgi:TldD protein